MALAVMAIENVPICKETMKVYAYNIWLHDCNVGVHKSTVLLFH